MELFTHFDPENSSSLGMALVLSSATPLLLLDEQLVIRAASETFCRTFDLPVDAVVGTSLFALGKGEWDKPQLRTLLEATARGQAAIEAYEFELKRKGKPDRILVLADGRRISVKDGWNGSNQERAFLRTIHASACKRFNTVLSPDYNAAHHDHFHFDMGGRGGFCR